MAQSSRTFRIFVSSTFSDLKAERNALKEKVLPCLQNQYYKPFMLNPFTIKYDRKPIAEAWQKNKNKR